MRALKLVSAVIVFGAVISSTACKERNEKTVKNVDTLVTTTKVRDTTVIKADTTVHTDTVKQTHHVPEAKKP